MEHIAKKRLWCRYCKDKIAEGEAYVIKDGEIFHVDCHIQSERFDDSFDVE